MTDNLLLTAGVSFITAFATNGNNGPARTLNLLWECVFGKYNKRLETYLENRQTSISEFHNDITNEISKIHPNNIVDEVDVSLIGPALDASKYYIEKEVIRKMFARLIGASLDKERI